MARAMSLNEVAEALSEVRKSMTTDDPGFRVEEIKEATGMSKAKINSLIRAGLDNGTVRRSTRLLERTDGRMTPVTTYVFLEKIV